MSIATFLFQGDLRRSQMFLPILGDEMGDERGNHLTGQLVDGRVLPWPASSHCLPGSIMMAGEQAFF